MGSLPPPTHGYKVPAASNPYASPLISERAFDEPRPLRVIYIGAGISGINAAIQFPKAVPNLELAVYDKNEEVGGTWFENRYPGCACDIPAHSYQLSYESSTEWTQFYATAAEILQYWKRVVEKYDLRKYMKLQHKCIEARWNETTSKWHVKFQRLDTNEVVEDVGDVFITGVGGLNTWRWPDIQGLHDFKGKLLHSANWDPSTDLKDKNIAVIGAGSSGIQIVPALHKTVQRMDHYVRGRTWIAATFGHELVEERNDGKDGNFTYTAEEKAAWRADRALLIKYRKALEAGMQGGFAVTHRGTKEHEGAWESFTEDMRKRLNKKPEIAEHLIPEFPPLCKRLTPGPGYLEALTADNVNVIPERISQVDATGITTADGKHRAVDAIVCATGFDTSFVGAIPIYGIGGKNLQERNKIWPDSYLTMGVDGFPNFFRSLGPNSAVGAGNLLMVIEQVANYTSQILQRLSTGNTLTVAPKKQAVQNFVNYSHAFFKRTVFSAECGSWYKFAPPGVTREEQKNAGISALWPGSSAHAIEVLSKVRWEDYDVATADGNDFGWFGDGWTTAERTGDNEGLTYYLNDSNIAERDLGDDDDNWRQKKLHGLNVLDDGRVVENGVEVGKVPNGIAAT